MLDKLINWFTAGITPSQVCSWSFGVAVIAVIWWPRKRKKSDFPEEKQD